VSQSSYGNWTLDCNEGFTPAELAEAVAEASSHIELRYVGGLGRAQAGFGDAAREASWVHLTLWDPAVTGMILTFERDAELPELPFSAKVETDVAKDRFGDDAARRAAIGALAKRCVDFACEKLAMKISAFDPKT
jgi:hypothetical protein